MYGMYNNVTFALSWVFQGRCFIFCKPWLGDPAFKPATAATPKGTDPKQHVYGRVVNVRVVHNAGFQWWGATHFIGVL